MKGWTNLKDEWPRSNSTVVVCYQAKKVWSSAIIHEKYLDNIQEDKVFWMYLPGEEDELSTSRSQRPVLSVHTKDLSPLDSDE